MLPGALPHMPRMQRCSVCLLLRKLARAHHPLSLVRCFTHSPVLPSTLPLNARRFTTSAVADRLTLEPRDNPAGVRARDGYGTWLLRHQRHDLRFSVEDRPVTRQDGDAEAVRARQARNLIDREIELPAGAIRVAPIEESVTGTIAFPAGDWAGEHVEGLVMRFERGRMVSFDVRTGRAGVERELQTAGEAGRSFREFALGFNPLLAIPAAGDRWIPYYGYGAGV